MSIASAVVELERTKESLERRMVVLEATNLELLNAKKNLEEQNQLLKAMIHKLTAPTLVPSVSEKKEKMKMGRGEKWGDDEIILLFNNRHLPLKKVARIISWRSVYGVGHKLSWLLTLNPQTVEDALEINHKNLLDWRYIKTLPDEQRLAKYRKLKLA